MIKRQKFLLPLLFLSVLFIAFFGVQSIFANEDGEGKLVYFIPVENEVERGLQAFLERSTQEAEENGANHIVFEIDTPGGRVDSAGQIARLLQELETPTTAYVVNEALSAGSYIALNADAIYMRPQATMGASGIITQDGNAAEQKAVSAWIEKMRTAAELNDRDPLYAAAMADETIDLPEYGAPEGSFLTLGPTDAVEVGYSEGTVQNREELLYEIGLSGATVVDMEVTFAENMARFLTSPIVIPILLSIASIGLIVELYSPGFGVPGIMGLSSLILFFYGHIVAGLAGTEAMILLLLGIVLIVAEFFVAGGILGLIGIGAVLASLFMSGYDIGHMTMSVSIALVASIIVAVILFKYIGMDKGVFRHIVLRDQTTTELGYVSTINRLELIGMDGVSSTPLRPSGTAVIGTERLDVVSDGGYIDANKPIRVLKVEGARIVVREI